MVRPQRLSLIAAVARNGVIGRDNALPWTKAQLPQDLPFFKRTTLGAPVIMGRRTWDSIGRPLPGRRNLVVTRQPGWSAAGAERCGSLDEALQAAGDVPEAFVIGGVALFEAVLPIAQRLVLTEIDHDFDGDVRFPAWDRARFVEAGRETHASPEGWRYDFVDYRVADGR
ncbi:dihydrofolate reductase [Aquabacterium sp. J223]|uniref:dihydrofolate reductase n=1 Tax=Aquabacterium sp. J223 TaxID=2898431 RepID=UPI0021ADF223|nr:dihydrofolate reductase [Aquabacterium sp. J223]UUX97677.1 dihydrofolate reductase [Aquabacterium sp. J223]